MKDHHIRITVKLSEPAKAYTSFYFDCSSVEDAIAQLNELEFMKTGCWSISSIYVLR